MDDWLESAYEDRNGGDIDTALETEYVSICPACGDPVDYCQGHGTMDDPWGAEVFKLHDLGDHSQCHPDADCEIF